jgi:hypothetical protein
MCGGYLVKPEAICVIADSLRATIEPMTAEIAAAAAKPVAKPPGLGNARGHCLSWSKPPGDDK